MFVMAVVWVKKTGVKRIENEVDKRTLRSSGRGITKSQTTKFSKLGNYLSKVKKWIWEIGEVRLWPLWGWEEVRQQIT